MKGSNRYYLPLSIVFLSIAIQCLENQPPQTKKGTHMDVDLGLNDKHRTTIADKLNQLLANEYVLYTKTLNYHWNVIGKFFGPLHTLFRAQYEQLQLNIDIIAERVRALGVMALGTLDEFSTQSTLSEQPGVNPDDMTMIKNLLDDHQTVIKQIRAIMPLAQEATDEATVNFLGDLIEKHEKTAWMLRAHLQ